MAITFGELKLEVTQAEIVFSTLDSIDLKSIFPENSTPFSNLEQAKENLAFQLFLAYRDGVCVEPHEGIAAAYLALYFSLKLPSSSADDALWGLSWWTTFRLADIRNNRFSGLLPFSPIHDKSMLSSNFPIFQFSYGLEVMTGIGKLVYHSFRPETNKDLANPEYIRKSWFKRLRERFSWERYKKIRNNNDFQSLMSNAIVWFLVNGLSLLFGLALGWLGAPAVMVLVIPSLIQIVGFTYDIYHDYKYPAEQRKAYQESLEVLNNLEKTINVNDTDYVKPTIQALKKKMQVNIDDTSKKIRRMFIIAVGICIGMAIFYFLPLLSGYVALHLPVAGATLLLSYDKTKALAAIVEEIFKTLGSSIALLFGFIYGGLIGRLWRQPGKIKSGQKFIKSNFLELVLSTALVYFKFAAFIPLMGSFIVGAPIVFLFTFIAVKSSVLILKKVEQYLKLSKPTLFRKERKKLASVLSKLMLTHSENNLIYNLKNLSKKERALLQKASGLDDSEWIRHLVNWTLPVPQREASLCYSDFDALYTKLSKQYGVSPVSHRSLPDNVKEIKEEKDEKTKEIDSTSTALFDTNLKTIVRKPSGGSHRRIQSLGDLPSQVPCRVQRSRESSSSSYILSTTIRLPSPSPLAQEFSISSLSSLFSLSSIRTASDISMHSRTSSPSTAGSDISQGAMDIDEGELLIPATAPQPLPSSLARPQPKQPLDFSLLETAASSSNTFISH
ncbi:MAG: hypothetical protein K0S27_256 [Gammaproteobacteria bacterium]|jgi:hypothetical protein|nr:hypothetical protein [Gammaproteobacteria bacterium]